MMFLSSGARQLAEARRITAALIIARQFEWKFDRTAPETFDPSVQTFSTSTLLSSCWSCRLIAPAPSAGRSSC
jgi:hypothetical protein